MQWWPFSKGDNAFVCGQVANKSHGSPHVFPAFLGLWLMSRKGHKMMVMVGIKVGVSGRLFAELVSIKKGQMHPGNL